MKANLLKELEGSIKNRKKQVQKSEVLNEVVAMLEYDGQRDVDVLRKIGGQSALAQSEKEKGKVIELENHEKFYSGSIFTTDQIIALGTKYRLKFLPSSRYTGYIDPSVAVEIRELERAISKSMEEDQANKRGLSVEEYRLQSPIKHQLDDYSLSNKFFILAPPKHFQLQKTPLIKKNEDPIMFYQIDNNHYRLIKKWGQDLTLLRFIKGFVTKSEARFRLLVLVFPIITIALLMSAYLSWWWMFLVVSSMFLNMIFSDFHDDFFGDSHTTSVRRFIF